MGSPPYRKEYKRAWQMKEQPLVQPYLHQAAAWLGVVFGLWHGPD